MIKTISAIYIPNENSQRTDPQWNWGGVSIAGNSQCMGNGFEDLMASLAMEFKKPTLNPGSTFSYYALFFAQMRQNLSRMPKNHHYFSTIYHASIVNDILAANLISVRVKRKSTKNVDFALAKLEQTERIILLSVNTSVGRHIIRVNSIAGENVNVNDPFGKNPYKIDRIGGFKNYTKQEIRDMGVNSVVWLETV